MARPTRKSATCALALTKMLNETANDLCYWIRAYQLDSFPVNVDYEDPAVRNHPCFTSCGRWEWDYWDVIVERRERGQWFLSFTEDLPDESVQRAHQRLKQAVKVLDNFIECVGAYTEDFIC
ncbi:MAG: hypothetical protein Q4E62_07425 [Sutterellaceae bacterium]|nr:hypothetical protein [Sutterellaceae bacterium]